MGDRLLQIVRQTGIFMVCAQMLLHFKPAECYEKYIRLLIGIMVLAQLIAAASQIFGGKGESVFDGRVAYYEELFAQSMEGADMEELEAILEKMTMAEVQAQINRIREKEAITQQKEAQERQGTALQQGGEEERQGTAIQQGGEEERQGTALQQGGEEVQPVETIDIQIDRIEVGTGD